MTYVCEPIHKIQCIPTELCRFTLIHFRMRWWYCHAYCLSSVIDNVMLGNIFLKHVDKILQSICCWCQEYNIISIT